MTRPKVNSRPSSVKVDPLTSKLCVALAESSSPVINSPDLDCSFQSFSRVSIHRSAKTKKRVLTQAWSKLQATYTHLFSEFLRFAWRFVWWAKWQMIFVFLLSFSWNLFPWLASKRYKHYCIYLESAAFSNVLNILTRYFNDRSFMLVPR